VFNYDDLDDLVAQGNLKYKIDFDFDYYVGEEYEDIKSNYPDEFDIQVGYNILKNFNITVYLSTED
jgi:hypothetical protein